MQDLSMFRARIRELYRCACPYDDGRRPTQADLAAAIGLSRAELNSRLNGTGSARLTERDIRAIVRTLAAWSALQSRAEAVELLTLMNCPLFSPAEWTIPPLDTLASPEFSAAPIPTPSIPHNLPYHLTSFIGRDAEVAHIRSALQRARLLTLVGTGGCGKTRLALETAATVLARFTDGVWLVDLAPLRDPTVVIPTLGATLGITEKPGMPLRDRVVHALRLKTCLIVLDNCEHLIDESAAIVDAIMRGCGNVTILATSREPLRVDGEVVWRVEPLAIPETTLPLAPDALFNYAGVRLFVERARAANPRFQPDAQNAADLQHICQQLEGLPLAIELAAARLRTMPLPHLAARLTDRFKVLTHGNRVAPPRQQTLQALVAWSYALLTEEEQPVFRRLTVFGGGFTEDAAVVVCAEPNVADVLDALVDKSLLLSDRVAPERRYHLLETIRQFGAALLSDSEQQETMARYSAWFLKLAQGAAPALLTRTQTEWLPVLEREHANFRIVLGHDLAHGDGRMALDLGCVLYRFWYMRGYVTEGRQWLDAILAATAGNQSVAYALGLCASALFAQYQSDGSQARALYSEALALARQLNHAESTILALNGLGVVAYDRGEYAQAYEWHTECLALRTVAGDTHGIAASLNNLGSVALAQSNLSQAVSLWEESLRLKRTMGDVWGIAGTVGNLATVVLYQGDYQKAQEMFEENVSIRRTLADKRGIAIALNNLSSALLYQGDTVRPQQLVEESLALKRELKDRRGIALSLHTAGMICAVRRDFSAAIDVFSESVAIGQEVGDSYAVAQGLSGLGWVRLLSGAPDAAQTAYAESLDMHTKLGDRTGCAACLEGLAACAAKSGTDERAAQLWFAAKTIYSTIGAKPFAPIHTALVSIVEPALGRLPSSILDTIQTQSATLSEADTLAEALIWAKGDIS